jgi:hypothetical protein
LLILSGCDTSGVCNKDCINANLQCNCCPVIDSIVNAKPAISEVNIFLETSGSMSGYMPSNSTTTSFQKIIPNIATRLKDLNIHFYSIKESSQKPQLLNLDDAISKISYGRFEWGLNTSIPIMLDTINNYEDSGKVAILISDMIYSPEEQKLVGQSVTLISDQIKNTNLSTSLLLLNSDFLGKNVKVSNSPYYILIQGKQENIDVIKSRIFASLKVFNQDYNEVNFGFSYSKPYYSVIPYADIRGTFESIECLGGKAAYLVLNNVDSHDSLGFWIGLNLENFPKYSRDLEYLKTNLSLNPTGTKASIEKIVTREIFEKMQDDDPTDKSIASFCTHFIRINVSELNDKISQLNLSLKSVKPNWITDNNYDEDKNADIIRDKTFGLTNIYTAINDAYQGQQAGLFFKDIKIILQKK